MNYIKADLIRIFNKNSFMATIGLYLLSFLGLYFVISNPHLTTDQFLSKTEIIPSLFPLVVGVSIFLAVYNDDFKSKSMQVAIGFGYERYKVVLIKFIEQVLLTFLIAIMTLILMWGVPSLTGLQFTKPELIQLAVNMMASVLIVIGYMSFAQILVFAKQNAISGLIFYILLATNTIYGLITLFTDHFLKDMSLNTTQWLYRGLIEKLSLQISQEKAISIITIATLLLYIIISIIITQQSYKKVELEF